jgi:diguanylate cyclase (GGDEF)-like protein
MTTPAVEPAGPSRVRKETGGTAILPAIRHAPPPTDAAFLVHIFPQGPNFGCRFSIGDEPALIGRDPVCLIHCPDRSVSRSHARVERRADGRFAVCDLGSSNGTFVNNSRVETADLRDGDYLRLGDAIFRFLSGSNVELDYHQEIHRLAVLDPLTGVHNRRALIDFLAREVSRSARHHRPLGLLMFDLDRFKSINDRLGHPGGDATLRAVVGRVTDLVRREDFVARFGGEEFAVVLPETGLDHAAACGERIRAAVADQPFEFTGQHYPVTVSVGASSLWELGDKTPEALLEQADGRLYEAKRSGRNRVCA